MRSEYKLLPRRTTAPCWQSRAKSTTTIHVSKINKKFSPQWVVTYREIQYHLEEQTIDVAHKLGTSCQTTNQEAYTDRFNQPTRGGAPSLRLSLVKDNPTYSLQCNCLTHRKSMGKTFGHLPVGKANVVTHFFVTLQDPSGLEITDDCHLCHQKRDYN